MVAGEFAVPEADILAWCPACTAQPLFVWHKCSLLGVFENTTRRKVCTGNVWTLLSHVNGFEMALSGQVRMRK